MATVTLTPDIAVEAGVAPTRTGSLNISNTYKFRNNGKTLLHFRKSGANNCTVTITPAQVVRGKAIANQTVAVPATTGDVIVGPFSRDVYDDVNHDVSFTVSEVTGLDVAVIQIP